MAKSLVMWNLKIRFCEKIKNVTSQDKNLSIQELDKD